MKKIALLAFGLSVISGGQVNAAASSTSTFEERDIDRTIGHQRLHVQNMTDCLTELSSVLEMQAALEKAQLRFIPETIQDLETAVSALNAIHEQLILMEGCCLKSLEAGVHPDKRRELDTSYGQYVEIICSQVPRTGFAGRLPSINDGEGEDINDLPITHQGLLGGTLTNVQTEDGARLALGAVTDGKDVCNNRLKKYTSYLKNKDQLPGELQAVKKERANFLQRIADSLSALSVDADRRK